MGADLVPVRLVGHRDVLPLGAAGSLNGFVKAARGSLPSSGAGGGTGETRETSLLWHLLLPYVAATEAPGSQLSNEHTCAISIYSPVSS